jgi:Ca-activated chloride channel homolog
VAHWYRRRRFWSFAGATVFAVGLIVVVRAVLSPAPSPLPERINDDCVQLIVNSSVEKDDLLRELAGRYNQAKRTFDGRCAAVSVYGTASGIAMDALSTGWKTEPDGAPMPHVWTPTSSMWRGLLQRRIATSGSTTMVPTGDFESVTRTVMTIAMPKPMAEALGWPVAMISWRDLYLLATHPDGWGSRGHPEWGRFALGRDNPHVSTSGLAATISTFYAAAGRSSDLTEADINDPEVTRFVRGVESSVLHYGDTALTFLANLAEADAKGEALSYVSAIVMQEQLAYLYNKGNPAGRLAVSLDAKVPNVPLVAVQPKEGAFALDHPYFVFESATDAQKAAAADFLAFLKEPEQQQQFVKFGFRAHDGTPSDDLIRSVGINREHRVPPLDPPPAAVLDMAMQGWDALRKKAKVLLVIDVSGSMSDTTGTGVSKLQAAKEAAVRALRLLRSDDKVGLWAFSSDGPGQPNPITELVAPDWLGDASRLTEAINGLEAYGGTALYYTTRTAQREMAIKYEPELINAMVLLTDGKNEYTLDTDLDRLIHDLEAADPARPVRIFTVAYGDKADFDVLTKIAKATRSSSYDARDPNSIDKVMVAVLSNF